MLCLKNITGSNTYSPKTLIEKNTLKNTLLIVQKYVTPPLSDKKLMKTPSNDDVTIVIDGSLLCWKQKIEALTNKNKYLKQQAENEKRRLEVLGQTWFSDNTITKYFEVLLLTLTGTKCSIVLMNPVIVEAVKKLSDMNVTLDPLRLHEKEILLKPINNAIYNHRDDDSTRQRPEHTGVY